MSVPFSTCGAARRAARRPGHGLARVLESGVRRSAPSVEAFEQEFAAFCGASEAVGVASGTDAIGSRCGRSASSAGDEVITAANTCVPTVAAIEAAGATPSSSTSTRATLHARPRRGGAAVTARTTARRPGPPLRPVRGHGRVSVARDHGLVVVEDAPRRTAPADGAPSGDARRRRGVQLLPDQEPRRTRRRAARSSGRRCVADAARECGASAGGATARVRRGSTAGSTRCRRRSCSVKLSRLDGWTERRRALAELYRERLAGSSPCPEEAPGARHAYHLFVVRSRGATSSRAPLERRGVGTLVHYPRAVHEQRRLPRARATRAPRAAASGSPGRSSACRSTRSCSDGGGARRRGRRSRGVPLVDQRGDPLVGEGADPADRRDRREGAAPSRRVPASRAGVGAARPADSVHTRAARVRVRARRAGAARSEAGTEELSPRRTSPSGPQWGAAVEGTGPLGVYHEARAGERLSAGRRRRAQHARLVRLCPRPHGSWPRPAVGARLGRRARPLRRARACRVPEVELDWHCREVPDPSPAPAPPSIRRSVHVDDTASTGRTTLSLPPARSSTRGLADAARPSRPRGDRPAPRERLPIALDAPSFVVLQRAGVYGYETEYLGWVVSRDELLPRGLPDGARARARAPARRLALGGGRPGGSDRPPRLPPTAARRLLRHGVRRRAQPYNRAR